MAHFAKLNENNIVVEIEVVNNDVIGNLPFPQSEPVGIEFLQNLFGSNTTWKQTSFNKNFRKNYAGVGYVYDAQKDAFIPPKPYDSWLLNETTCTWVSPVSFPNDGKDYSWDESVQNWVVKL
jgi:hypothetical protein